MHLSHETATESTPKYRHVWVTAKRCYYFIDQLISHPAISKAHLTTESHGSACLPRPESCLAVADACVLFPAT